MDDGDDEHRRGEERAAGQGDDGGRGVRDERHGGDIGGAVRVGLAVLRDDLDAPGLAVVLDPAGKGLRHRLQHIVIGLRKPRQRAGARADMAHPKHRVFRNAVSRQRGFKERGFKATRVRTTPYLFKSCLNVNIV